MDTVDAPYHLGGSIPIFSKTTFAKCLLAVLRFLRVVVLFFQRLFLSVKPITHPLFTLLLKWLIVPLYTLWTFARLRLTHTMSSAHGFFLVLFTNKFVLHAVLLLISVSTIAVQFQTRTATAADVGQGTILYAFLRRDAEETIQEEITDAAPFKPMSYLGEDTIQAVPDIDFDYENDTLADLTVPGSIAEQPGTLEIGDEPYPADAVVVRSGIETYTVRSGDAVSAIARRFGLTVGTIIQANQLSKRASIKPGDTLKIPPVSGVLHTAKRGDTIGKLARSYQADVDKIIRINGLEMRALTIGEDIIIPDGIPLPVTSKSTIALKPGIPASKILHKTYDAYGELVDTRIDLRIKPADANTDNVHQEKMLWPTSQRVVTQYYGLRHTGMDIDGDYSDAIYAAAAGRIEQAGWNGSGYGLQIVIDHMDGRKTRYAHASKLFVKAGDSVKKGQVMAMVGTTGRSTGTHLHFEVYINGRRKNPLAYIK